MPNHKEIQGLHEADSLALDLHKWMCMPYETGCVLIKNKELHRKAFQLDPPYLTSHERGLPAGPESFGNYGLQLSRGFRALKVWMSLKEHGSEKYKRIIKQNIAPIIKGGGGGQKTLATAGGQDAGNLDKVIATVKGLL